jgi:hypothetical protein
MKRLVLVLFFINFCLLSFSQRVYYIYIQSEAEQPFYVKMNEKIVSSAAKGYLILSNLRDSTYNFAVGFAGNKIIEQKFSVTVRGNDQGYLLKNFNEKGWGLFDLQTMSVKMNLSDAEIAIEKKAPVKKDESVFTQILAKASDDSTLLEKPDLASVKETKKDTVAKEVVIQNVPKPEEKKTEAIIEVKPVEIKKADPIIEKAPENIIPKTEIEKPAETKKTDSVIEKTPENIIPKTEVEKPLQIETFKRSEVTRRSESSTTEGFGLVFIDEYSNGAKDTIRILIPPVKEIIVPKEEPKAEKKFLEITDTVKKAEQEPVMEIKSNQTSIAQTNSQKRNTCTSIADQDDFLKLRKRMASESNDDNMITEAKKIFKTKCFTTLQIRNCSTLFLNDHGKYNFFDAAYSYVSDIENFSSLLTEIKDEYYQNRFKAMLR